MLTIIKIRLFLLLALLMLVSCEEVIDIDLNSSESVLVVDGFIYEGENAHVRLSMTSDYFSADTSVLVTDAVVTLNDDHGGSEVLQHFGDGVYRGVSIQGTPGHTYSLSIENEGEVYEGDASLIPSVEIYDVIFSVSPYMPPHASGEEMRYVMDVKFSDDTLVDNFYMLRFWNDSIEESYGYFLISDQFTNTDTVTANSRMLSFAEGSYTVQVYSIDEGTSNFYNEMNDLDGGGGGSTPYNPKSNFGSDVMGYFTALSFTTDSGIVVPTF